MAPAPARPRPGSAEIACGVALFAGAVLAIALVLPHSSLAVADGPTLLFFLLFGLFTISIGYAHPVFGHVSFDRVAQVSSILVFGPVDAAWLNGLASLLYPWHRLRKGIPLPNVALAALSNAGLMTLMILGAGLAYEAVGGEVPLMQVGFAAIGPLLLLLLAMQAINEAGMLLLVRARAQPTPYTLSLSDTATELMAGLVAVLVAIVWNRMETAVFVLLLTVLAAGMLALRNFAEMRLRLERLVEMRTAALHEKTQQLERLVARDALTGLFNRRHADQFLLREVERAGRERFPITVAIADVDHFKQINDEHSHGVGDRVLGHVGHVLNVHLRDGDLVARYGGEEFLLCFLGLDEPAAARACEQLRIAIERAAWHELSPGLRVTMSIGVACSEADPDVASLLEHADAGLYRAKRLGRNRVEIGTYRRPTAP